MMKSKIFLGALLGVSVLPAWASDYPSKPIRLVVPYAPGGSTDNMSRSLAKLLAEQLKQAVIVDNKPGAGTMLGTNEVARSSPDGHTLVVATNALTINPSLIPGFPARPLDVLAPVALFASAPNVLVVSQSLGVSTVADLIKMAQSQPGKLNYATSGIGTSIHLGMEVFKQRTQTDIQPIHYKGAAPARNDLVAGITQIMQGNVANSLPFIQDGKFVPLGVTSLTRSPLLPKVPTLDEAGVKGFDVVTWYGILAPKKTPQPIIDQLNKAINAVIRDKELAEKLAVMDGAVPEGGSPQQFGTRISKDLVFWREVIKKGNITPE
ncbi:Bug family tripartite tricarboxylate transporter substrate binding protein [Ottowia thiooxydans]|uniref:Tripartite-type tricarboxylate transporter receptor subunit TctC n=1 Tax=Ottowia thiooxydans TaxID=219182 RepID=A0ABV2Q1W4_9BURK